MTGRLRGKVAIVTGAGCIGPGWGNGRATCVRFAEEGAKIFGVDRDLDSAAETVERVKKAGGEIVLQQCDVTDSASVAAMVAACMKLFGRVDILSDIAPSAAALQALMVDNPQRLYGFGAPMRRAVTPETRQ